MVTTKTKGKQTAENTYQWNASPSSKESVDWTEKIANGLDKISSLKAIRNYIIAGTIGLTVAYCSDDLQAKVPIRDSVDKVINYLNPEVKKTKATPKVEEKKIEVKKSYLSETELDSVVKNMKFNRVENVMKWDTLITKIEKKYDLQQGILGGMSMEESFAHPLMLNFGDEGSGGLVMYMPGSAKEVGLKTYGNSKSFTRDTIHGKELRKLIKNKPYSEVKKLDERFDLEKSLDAAGKQLAKRRELYGTYTKAVISHNKGSVSKATHYTNMVNHQYNQRVRGYQLQYLKAKQAAGQNVDTNLMNQLESIVK